MTRVSYRHLTLKFPTNSGVGKVRGDQALARACYASDSKKNAGPEMMDLLMISFKHGQRSNEVIPPQEASEEKRKLKPEPVEKLIAIALVDHRPESD